MLSSAPELAVCLPPRDLFGQQGGRGVDPSDEVNIPVVPLSVDCDLYCVSQLRVGVILPLCA